MSFSIFDLSVRPQVQVAYEVDNCDYLFRPLQGCFSSQRIDAKGVVSIGAVCKGEKMSLLDFLRKGLLELLYMLELGWVTQHRGLRGASYPSACL